MNWLEKETKAMCILVKFILLAENLDISGQQYSPLQLNLCIFGALFLSPGVNIIAFFSSFQSATDVIKALELESMPLAPFPCLQHYAQSV